MSFNFEDYLRNVFNIDGVFNQFNTSTNAKREQKRQEKAFAESAAIFIEEWLEVTLCRIMQMTSVDPYAGELKEQMSRRRIFKDNVKVGGFVQYERIHADNQIVSILYWRLDLATQTIYALIWNNKEYVPLPNNEALAYYEV